MANQTEVPGTERPTIPELETAFDEFLKARAAETAAKTKHKEKRLAATTAMRAVVDQLERDENENPCYVYRCDGEETSLALSTSDKLVVKSLSED